MTDLEVAIISSFGSASLLGWCIIVAAVSFLSTCQLAAEFVCAFGSKGRLLWHVCAISGN